MYGEILPASICPVLDCLRVDRQVLKFVLFEYDYSKSHDDYGQQYDKVVAKGLTKIDSGNFLFLTRRCVLSIVDSHLRVVLLRKEAVIIRIGVSRHHNGLSW